MNFLVVTTSLRNELQRFRFSKRADGSGLGMKIVAC